VRHPSRRPLSLALLALLCAPACGYHAVRYAGALPGVERVAINGIENKSFEPGVDQMVTDALYREFLRRGALRLVDDPAAADLVIDGSVAGVEIAGRSFSSISFSLEFEVRMILDVTVTRPDGTVMEIDPRALSESELYLASADIEVARTNREEALRRVASTLAGRIHDALYERMEP
jgi:hypothetical protein